MYDAINQNRGCVALAVEMSWGDGRYRDYMIHGPLEELVKVVLIRYVRALI